MQILKSTRTVNRLAEQHHALVSTLPNRESAWLGLVQSGEDPVSAYDKTQTHEIDLYRSSLSRYAGRIGSLLTVFGPSPERLTDKIVGLVQRQDISGLMILSPLIGLPKELARKAFDQIPPHKDLDGLSQASMDLGLEGFVPATALATSALMKANGIDPRGRVVARIGNGLTVGKPLGLIHEQQGVAETIITSKNDERELRAAVAAADIVIAAAGVPGMVKADMLHPGQVVIGVGARDIDDGVYKAGYAGRLDISVTRLGGVGPLTSAFLHEHLLQATQGDIAGGLSPLELVQFGFEQEL